MLLTNQFVKVRIFRFQTLVKEFELFKKHLNVKLFLFEMFSIVELLGSAVSITIDGHVSAKSPLVSWRTHS